MEEKTPTQDFLIQSLISEVVSYIVEDQNVSINEALKIFYSTKISEKLEQIDTGLYLEGAGYFYELVKEELEKSQ